MPSMECRAENSTPGTMSRLRETASSIVASSGLCNLPTATRQSIAEAAGLSKILLRSRQPPPPPPLPLLPLLPPLPVPPALLLSSSSSCDEETGLAATELLTPLSDHDFRYPVHWITLYRRSPLTRFRFWPAGSWNKLVNTNLAGR